MRIKKACIVVDLRTGQDVTTIPHLVAVFAAAGWKTHIALKEYGGETVKLAQKAAKEGYDLVIGYGGDGTLNAVLNGVRDAAGECLVADVPGGTYNVWAGAIGVPHDPVKAALAIVNSQARAVDLGHVEVKGLTFPPTVRDERQPTTIRNNQQQLKGSSTTRQSFLLHVGLGIEAAMMAHISKPLKYRVGPLAFDLAMLKELPHQRPFPVELEVMTADGTVETRWQGEVWDVIVSKVPYFGGSINIEPEARVDDGLLSVHLVTATNAVRTVEQALSILLQHKLDEGTTKHFRGAHFSLRVPASIDMHVDGSIVKLEQLVAKAARETLQQTDKAQQVMVSYQFDAEPRVVQLAIPRTYDGSLFERSSREGDNRLASQRLKDDHASRMQEYVPPPRKGRRQEQQRLGVGQEPEYRVTVVGVAPHPGKKRTAIIAGRYKQQNTGEMEVVAVRVTAHALIFNGSGERVSPTAALELQEGAEIVVTGEKTKRGVIRASCVRFSG